MTSQIAYSANPFLTGFSVGYHMQESGIAVFSLTNPNGTVIHETTEDVEKGYNTYTFDTFTEDEDTLEPGLYFLTMNFGKHFQIVKILKQAPRN